MLQLPISMDPGNAIEIDHIVKDFRVYERSFGTLKAQTMHIARRMLHRERGATFIMRRALDNLTLSVPKGQSVSLIGHNGSGKSTLLSILARIYLPTEGEVRIRGKVSSMLELGIGFNDELTGIENVFFSCTLRGMTREWIEDRFQSIKEFSELDDATLALPMRMYSSGMAARLGFAVAVHVESDIVLIDEGLAVGDVRFQEKCLNRLNELKAAGKTIFLVTHATFLTLFEIDRAIWLIQGAVHRDGPADEIVPEYREHMLGSAAAAAPKA